MDMTDEQMRKEFLQAAPPLGFAAITDAEVADLFTSAEMPEETTQSNWKPGAYCKT